MCKEGVDLFERAQLLNMSDGWGGRSIQTSLKIPVGSSNVTGLEEKPNKS